MSGNTVRFYKILMVEGSYMLEANMTPETMLKQWMGFKKTVRDPTYLNAQTFVKYLQEHRHDAKVVSAGAVLYMVHDFVETRGKNQRRIRPKDIGEVSE